MLCKVNLEKGCWYIGRGRNADIALWMGDRFVAIGNRYGVPCIKIESHYDDGGPFEPFKKIILEEE